MSTVSLPLTKALAASSSPSPTPSPKQTDDQVVWTPRTNPKVSTLRSKWRPLILRAPKRVAEMMVGLAHPQLPPSRQLPSSHGRLRALKCSFCSGKKEHTSCLTSTKAPELDGSVSPSSSCFQKFIVSLEPQVYSPLVPRKGNQEHVTTGAKTLLRDKAADQD